MRAMNNVTSINKAPSLLVSQRQVLGLIARYAIEQSPYPVPDNLETVLQAFARSTDDEFAAGECGFMTFANQEHLVVFLQHHLSQIPEFMAWNDRKNGNDAPVGFVSTWQAPDPDNDFIDLYALIGNVANAVTMENAE